MTGLPVRSPKLNAPPGSTDCHIHIYGPREVYPLAPGSRYPPPLATPAMYRDVMRRLGMERVVVVQPTAYGDDNNCLVDALSDLGPIARGVATVKPDVSRGELDRLTKAGVRAARFFLLPGSIMTWDMLAPVARRVAEFGWHVQLQFDGRDCADYEPIIRDLPCDAVIDHNGKFLEPVATNHPGMISLLRLLDTGKIWVKASGAYETSRTGPPDYADIGPIARALIGAAPEKVVWASNWPHGGSINIPDDAELLDLLSQWVVERSAIERILVGNPDRLYFAS